VSQFVHHCELRTANEQGIQVHLRQRHTAILNGPTWNGRNALNERVGFLASVGFDVANNDISACLQFPLGRFEHRIGFPHTGTHAEKHLKTAAFPRSFLALNGT
jgi:hypothetical protein